MEDLVAMRVNLAVERNRDNERVRPGKTTADSDIVEARFIDIVPGVRVVQAVTSVADDPASRAP